LNTLYHLSVPVRTPWVSDLPGSFLALSIWILGSFVLRWVLQSTVGGTSIYGPLAAPIAVLMWLYMTAIAVLIGAALNAVVDRLWPHKARVEHREAEARAAGSDDVEAVMKAEAEPQHEEAPLTPVEQERPEVQVAEKIEQLSAEPASAPAPAPAPAVAPGAAPASVSAPGAAPASVSAGKSGARTEDDDLR
jgi:membrane protein